ncbi:MAG: hypothetical protein ABL921_06590 [Pirellula sp.]
MNRWVSYLLLFAFVRLQFICCCGSIVHLETSGEASPVVESPVVESSVVESSVVESSCAAHLCGCGHGVPTHSESTTPTKRTKSTIPESCATPFCDCESDCDHKHHFQLHVLHAVMLASLSKVAIESQDSSSFVAIGFSNAFDRQVQQQQSYYLSNRLWSSAPNILTRFGQLRI